MKNEIPSLYKYKYKYEYKEYKDKDNYQDDKHHTLYHALASYSQSGAYPFHMPGHKRQLSDFGDAWALDITEVHGFDDLHHATGILERLQQRAARLFGSPRSFVLVGGSTCGVLAAVSACVPMGGKLLLSRNCHKSVYHAMELRRLTASYLMPELTGSGILGSLPPDSVRQALSRDPAIDAVLVTSPTYDGVASDIRSIARLAHSHGIPLIVDEAHGAHFPLSDLFPDSALACGADVTIQSLHKTLPAFTQTAVLHVSPGLVDEAKLRRFLGMYQSSSPSYLLMASVDRCLTLLEESGAQRFLALRQLLDEFYDNAARLSHMECLRPEDVFAWDDSRLLLSGRRLGLSGPQLSHLLRQDYQIELEMAAGHYALALCSLMDTREGFSRLYQALAEIEGRFPPGALNPSAFSADMISRSHCLRLPEQPFSIADAAEKPMEAVLLEDAAGRVSGEYVSLYPPGIPLIVPGERIEPELLSQILCWREQGAEINGLSDWTNRRINVVIS